MPAGEGEAMNMRKVARAYAESKMAEARQETSQAFRGADDLWVEMFAAQFPERVDASDLAEVSQVAGQEPATMIHRLLDQSWCVFVAGVELGLELSRPMHVVQ